MPQVATLNKISKVYGRGRQLVRALHEVSLTIARGNFLVITGPSGSGKSTLLNILGLLDRQSTGSYELDGTKIVSMNDRQLSRLRAERIGFVFQRFNLIPQLTVRENVALPLKYARKPTMYQDRVDILIERVGLAHREQHFPAELSGGEMQRAAIARALVMNPSLILADEPTGNLDQANSRSILSFLRDESELGATVILVSHNVDAVKYCNRQVTLEDGYLFEVASA